jgi:hypothetical protein
MSDSAFFYVIGSNLLIDQQKIQKKVVGCFDIILSYQVQNAARKFFKNFLGPKRIKFKFYF